MPNLALKDNQKSKVVGRSNGGGVTRLCKARLPSSFSDEEKQKTLNWLLGVFPGRIKLERVDDVTKVVLSSPRNGDCDKFGDCLEVIVEALAQGKEPSLPIPTFVGSGVIKKASSSFSLEQKKNTAPALPSRRHERGWRRPAAAGE